MDNLIDQIKENCKIKCGNNEYIVNWAKKDNFNRAKTTLERLYLKKGLTWSFVTSGKFSMRYFPNGFLWDVSGSPAFFNDDDLMYYTLGFLCTNFANSILILIFAKVANYFVKSDNIQ